VDILVNNLGIYEPKPFETISDEDWRHVFEVNVLSGVLSRAYVSGMKQRNWGRIVFISSESAISTPKENDSLRHDEDRSTRGLAWPGGLLRWDRGHRELDSPRTDSLCWFRGLRGAICSPVASAITGAALRADGGVVSTCF
jgi:short subunit dehydrogenase